MPYARPCRSTELRTVCQWRHCQHLGLRRLGGRYSGRRRHQRLVFQLLRRLGGAHLGCRHPPHPARQLFLGERLRPSDPRRRHLEHTADRHPYHNFPHRLLGNLRWIPADLDCERKLRLRQQRQQPQRHRHRHHLGHPQLERHQPRRPLHRHLRRRHHYRQLHHSPHHRPQPRLTA